MVSLLAFAALQPASAAATRAPVPGSSCTVFPANNVWNMDISKLPIAKKNKVSKRSMSALTASTALLSSANSNKALPYRPAMPEMIGSLAATGTLVSLTLYRVGAVAERRRKLLESKREFRFMRTSREPAETPMNSRR